MRKAVARIAVGIGALFVAAAGAGQSASVPGSGVRGPTFATQAVESRPISLQPRVLPESVLYSFEGGSNGYIPWARLISINAVLYGTTAYGGANGCGTFFQVTTSGTETVLYSFQGGSDGCNPIGGLTDVNGVLYGTTGSGGANSSGIVFSITTSGVENVLHSFGGGNDGAFPYAGLTNVAGVLYGTTRYGGPTRNGTVFAITTSGIENVLYSFAYGSDAAFPQAALTNLDGVLYGTTPFGGASGVGTVFSVTIAGKESVVYSFAAGRDGGYPLAGLTNVNGVLYGTTSEYGLCGICGTVFKVTTTGTEEVLHRFAGGKDGIAPHSGLINVNGVLYGTTSWLGYPHTSNDGTVFQITTEGVKTVLHSFAGPPDGSAPNVDVTYLNGVLYGTTWYGGAYGHGVIFAITL